MFLGTHTPRLDDKGRLAMPARFRSDLEGGLVRRMLASHLVIDETTANEALI